MPAILGVKVDVVVDMVVNEREGGLTSLNREVHFNIPLSIGLAAGYIESLFRRVSSDYGTTSGVFGRGRTLIGVTFIEARGINGPYFVSIAQRVEKQEALRLSA